MFKNALVSCSDKTGLADFLLPLAERGMRIVSTGGTAEALREKGIGVVDVSEQTGFPEVMDGRVKTLHPCIHMGLLARLDNADDIQILKNYEIEPFDLVIGNLYPFESKPSIETIDIGGPSFLRAAAKNHSRITVLSDPKDYSWVAERIQQGGEVSLPERQRLAAKLFAHTASYDSMIARHFAGDSAIEMRDFALGGEFVQTLRYGENPQQRAAWYRARGAKLGLHQALILQGKELSYNNILDLEAAVSTLRDLSGYPACVAVKHNNPCGAAIDESPELALAKGLGADPQSVFGGIVAVNFAITAKMAESLGAIFLECLIAPSFDADARDILQKKKNLRVLVWPDMTKGESTYQVRTVAGGFLVQNQDIVAREWKSSWQVIGDELNATIRGDLLLAWRICAHLKSNAIALATNGQSVGLGMGQVNRVDAVEQAIQRMRRFHPGLTSAVLASDAFFPFPDSIDKIADAGVKHIIQPGGSVKDAEVLAQAKARGVTVVLTGERHFLH
jgi:phosphoribosylaminoimidazolecarboxamide formyltransferase/IMP cyclohydrolase